VQPLSGSNLSLRQTILRRSRQDRDYFYRELSRAPIEEQVALIESWAFNARPNQLMPPEVMPGGSCHTWLILAGRGFGKTRVGAETILAEARAGRSGRIALVAETAADARDVLIEGDSGILANAPRDFKPTYEPSKRKVTFPNGAVAHTYNATEPDQLRGPQHDFAWCDEAAKWRYAQETWDMLQFGLRLGEYPRQVVTTTPRPIPLIRELVKDENVHITKGRTMDNAANLAKTFLNKIIKRYEGTRLGRQELEAEILDDMPGALWTRAMLEKAYLTIDKCPPMEQIVVSLDPSGISDDDDEGDSIGIIVAGKAGDHGYILEDLTCREGPAEWAKRCVDAYHRWGADAIIAEVNFGGAMVEHTIRTINSNVPVRVVHASRGKFIRAEPVSALYEQGRIHHLGTFSELEDQMTLLTRAGYQGLGSPDRLDAMVWAITDMLVGDIEAVATSAEVRGLY